MTTVLLPVETQLSRIPPCPFQLHNGSGMNFLLMHMLLPMPIGIYISLIMTNDTSDWTIETMYSCMCIQSDHVYMFTFFFLSVHDPNISTTLHFAVHSVEVNKGLHRLLESHLFVRLYVFVCALKP